MSGAGTIRLRGVAHAFAGQQVIAPLDLDLPATGCVALVGPSGSGKTTLLDVVAGLVVPDAGVVHHPPGLRVSYAFQDDRLLPWSTALDNVAVALPGPPDRARAEAAAWLDRLGLAEAAGKRPGELSGGMCRRVGLARALAHAGAHPGTAVLLDEPTRSLDAASREAVLALLAPLPAERLVLLVTHDHDEARRLAGVVHVVAGTPLRVLRTLGPEDLGPGGPGLVDVGTDGRGPEDPGAAATR